MDLSLFLLVIAGTAGLMTLATFLNLLRSHRLHRAFGLAATFFAGAVAGFMTAILLGTVSASLMGVDGRLQPVPALLFLGFIGVMCLLGGGLAVKAMARILHWRPQAKG